MGGEIVRVSVVRYAYDIQVYDLVAAAFDDVDHTGEERFLDVAGDDHLSRNDQVGLGRFYEKGPDEAALVDLLDIGGDDHLNRHRNLPSRARCFIRLLGFLPPAMNTRCRTRARPEFGSKRT